MRHRIARVENAELESAGATKQPFKAICGFSALCEGGFFVFLVCL